MASEKSDSERCFGGGWLDVFDAVAENQAARERFDALDLGRDKKSFLSWRIRRCNFYQRTQLVLLEAVEANAAFRNIFTFDHFVRVRLVANARAEAHSNANVAPLVNGPPVGTQFANGPSGRHRRRRRG